MVRTCCGVRVFRTGRITRRLASSTRLRSASVFRLDAIIVAAAVASSGPVTVGGKNVGDSAF